MGCCVRIFFYQGQILRQGAKLKSMLVQQTHPSILFSFLRSLSREGARTHHKGRRWRYRGGDRKPCRKERGRGGGGDLHCMHVVEGCLPLEGGKEGLSTLFSLLLFAIGPSLIQRRRRRGGGRESKPEQMPFALGKNIAPNFC